MLRSTNKARARYARRTWGLLANAQRALGEHALYGDLSALTCRPGFDEVCIAADTAHRRQEQDEHEKHLADRGHMVLPVSTVETLDLESRNASVEVKVKV